MRRAAALTLLVVACSLTLSAQSKRQLALVGSMVLDGYEVPPLHHAVVLVEGDRIVAKGRVGEVPISPDAAVIDTRGRTMMPGLIDLHVHMMILGHGNYGRWFPWIRERGLVDRVMEISAKQLLRAGVTLAADLASPLNETIAVRDRINAGKIPGPRMWMSGPWITRTLGNYPPDMFEIKAETPEQAAAAAERLIKAGVDIAKVYPLTFDQYRAVVGVLQAAPERKLTPSSDGHMTIGSDPPVGYTSTLRRPGVPAAIHAGAASLDGSFTGRTAVTDTALPVAWTAIAP